MTLVDLLGKWFIEKGFKSWEVKYRYSSSSIVDRIIMHFYNHSGVTRMIIESNAKIVKIERIMPGDNAWYNLTNSTLDMSDPDSFDKLEKMLKGLG